MSFATLRTSSRHRCWSDAIWRPDWVGSIHDCHTYPPDWIFVRGPGLAGGRVIVAPTSEVLHDADSREVRALTWREQAGRIRAMLTAYSFVTLVWAIPGMAAIGLLLATYRTFNGSPLALADWVRAWAWNVLHLASTLTARRRARASRLAGDQELFRYQVRGSVEFRAVGSEVGALLQGEIEDGDDEDLALLLDGSPGFWQQPAFLAAIFGTVFVAAFTRVIWSEGMPAAGFTLPLGDSPWDTLRAYAGGWHLGGLGGPEPMHPSVGATAAVHLLFGAGASLAASVMTIGSVALGAAGVTRLVRRLRLGHAARYLSGVVYVAGVPLTAVLGMGYWPALLAAGTLPWVLAAVVHPLPTDRRALLGRIARISLALAWTISMVPTLIVVPLGFALAWSLATRRFGPTARAGLFTIIALPALFPWLLAETPQSLLTGGIGLAFRSDLVGGCPCVGGKHRRGARWEGHSGTGGRDRNVARFVRVPGRSVIGPRGRARHNCGGWDSCIDGNGARGCSRV